MKDRLKELIGTISEKVELIHDLGNEIAQSNLEKSEEIFSLVDLLDELSRIRKEL